MLDIKDGLQTAMESCLSSLSKLEPGSKEYACVLQDLKTLHELSNVIAGQALDTCKFNLDMMKLDFEKDKHRDSLAHEKSRDAVSDAFTERKMDFDEVRLSYEKEKDERDHAHTRYRETVADAIEFQKLDLEKEKEKHKEEELKHEKRKLIVDGIKEFVKTGAVVGLTGLAIVADEKGWLVSKLGLNEVPKIKLF